MAVKTADNPEGKSCAFCEGDTGVVVNWPGLPDVPICEPDRDAVVETIAAYQARRRDVPADAPIREALVRYEADRRWQGLLAQRQALQREAAARGSAPTTLVDPRAVAAEAELLRD
jgi:hypothetical protein